MSRETTEYSLGPERRLKKRSDYLRAQSSRKKVSSRHFLLSYLQRQDEEDKRFGVTITTKVHKRAVRRNKLRRRLKDCYRVVRPKLIPGAYDVVIIARAGACDLPFDKLRSEFKYLMYESKLLPGKPGHRSRSPQKGGSS